MVDLGPLNTTLRERGIRFQVEQRSHALVVRGTFPQLDGTRKRSRITLDLKAVTANLVTAELRCLQLHNAIESGTYPPDLPWTEIRTTPESPSTAPSCEAAIRIFETHYWETRPRTTAAERTWDRTALELRRLPQSAPITLTVLTSTITSRTTPGTRTRVECCKVYKRLARLLSLEGDLNQISLLQGHYEPAERQLPDDASIGRFLDAANTTKWGWCYAALAAFGCRPAEIPSLIPSEDGTAQCLTIKRRNKAPAIRTCFAFPKQWIERYDLCNVRIPNEARWTVPSEYDSALGKKFVDSWRHSRRSQEMRDLFAELLPDFDLYDLRHRWAIRSIEANKPLTLCAKAMGHSAAVHEQTYHRHIQAEDLRRAMASESA